MPAEIVGIGHPMTGLMNSGLLPASSLARLSQLAARALDAGERAALRASVVAVPFEWLGDAVACGDVRNDAPLPFQVDAGAAAWVLVPLPGAGDPDEGGLALCVSSGSRRAWNDSDIAALSVVAATAAMELQLRADLARHGRTADDAHVPSLRDGLTDLASRALFLDRVAMMCLRHARHDDLHFAVMSVSIEQFEGIASTFGYDAARDVLREFADRLRSVVRGYDSIARFDGDEFGILLESIRDQSDAARVANRVHDALRAPIASGTDQFRVTANIGIVLSFSGIDSAARFTQLAALARGRARSSGAPYEIFDPVMQQHAQARLSREMDLRRGVDAGEFELHYQPIVSMSTGRIVNTEALVRWRHPRRGLVNAAEFITLAEEIGLAVPLDWFTIDQACRQLRSWREGVPGESDLGVSVNVTAAHFRQRDVAQHVGSILHAQGVSGGISLEVTERMLIGNIAQAKTVLQELRALGVGIHLDDFGTGYSSLQYLHELPFDVIKIDRSFVARMLHGGRDAQLVTTIRELARQLGVPVIAEGVETPEHLALVRELGCEFAQGYLFARPLPSDEMQAMLASGPQW